MSKLRGFQAQLKHGCYNAFQAGAMCVMAVLPTGGGKSVITGDIAREYDGYGCIMAHRSYLNTQLSLALAKEGVRHDIVAPKEIIKTIVTAHMEEVGRSYYDARANWKVASVDTLIRRDMDERYLKQCGLVLGDEGHHFLRGNKWGRAVERFPNARTLLFTATPDRADRLGLGRCAAGYVDTLVEGPEMRWLIDNAYLTDYVIKGPTPGDFNMDGVERGADGDYNKNQMRKRVKGSAKIIGDVVDTYLKYARGKLGITFAVDNEHAADIAKAYCAAGVPAVIVSHETPETERRKIMAKFKAREILQLVNVDLFGEGVDVPAVEVVSMARPTASYSLFVQQFGRALRLMISPVLAAAWDTYTVEQRKKFIAESGKPYALILDHVGNMLTHMGPPDWRQWPWSLESTVSKRGANDAEKLRYCTNPECLEPYLRILTQCPKCNTVPPPPKDRSRPEFVDGDVVLYTQELLEELFGKKNKVDGPCHVPMNASPLEANSIRKNHRTRQEAQTQLRAAMGLFMPPTRDERVNNKRFFMTFGVDVLTAHSLSAPDADKLRERILEKVTL